MFSRLAANLLALTAATAAAPLNETEQRIAAAAEAGMATFAAELEAHVKISSPTEDHAGVRRLGAWFEAEFARLGFDVRWSPIPDAKRSGHVVAERRGAQGRRLLLIGHLDTVLPAGEFRIENGRAYGSGTNDMKGGNLVLLHALRALHLERPAGETAAGHRAGVADGGLEREGRVAARGEIVEVAAADGHRLARVLLVAGEDDRDAGVLERASGVQRAQGVQNHEVAALHVVRARAVGAAVLDAEVAGGQDGVEVADEQQAPALGAAALGHDMARALRLGNRRPARGETELGKLGLEPGAEFSHAGVVLGGRTDLHVRLEFGGEGRHAGFGGGGDFLFGLGERGSERGRG